MPYQSFYDPDEYSTDDDGEIQPIKSPFEYDAASGKFEAGSFDGVVAVIHKALMNLGATRMRVTYDGGNDEGFAHADDVWFGADRVSIEEATDRLSTPLVDADLRKAAGEPGGSHWGDPGEMYAGEKPAKLALDELAHELASALLGTGYGTGEYELYGALEADLATGEIEDDPSASKPLDRY